MVVGGITHEERPGQLDGCHLAHCVAEAVAEGGDTAAGKVREASDAIARLVKS